jgi:signal transduction histidine kinase
MFRKDRWPFIPTALSELIDRDTLAVIQSGCCERLQRPLVLFDYNPQTGGFSDRIESINLKQRFEGFCATFRQEVPGGEEACRRCNLEQAAQSLHAFEESGERYRTFQCHLGLQEATYVILAHNRPVALLYTGQYLPPGGFEELRRNVAALGSGPDTHLNPEGATREKLLAWASSLPAAPEDLPHLLQREAEYIQRMAQAEYRQGKYQWEQEFLDTLRQPVGYDETISLLRLRRHVRDLLARTQEFCRCEYLVFFASVQEGDTVLPPIAAVGTPAGIGDKLPHFNWKKAGLPLDQFETRAWDIVRLGQEAGTRGIRGDNSRHFSGAACLIPSSLGNRYRSVLAFGPFAESVDLAEEMRFLLGVAEAISSQALIHLELRNLEQERRRWKSTAMLITHQLSTTVTPITTRIGRARYHAQKLEKGAAAERVTDLLKRAEDLSLNLRDSARKTMDSHILHLEPEDFEYEKYPLSVLVANCVEGFIPRAEVEHLHFEIEPSVELLPEAVIDVARLTIALSNLLENAVKYSYPNTTIYVRGSFHSMGRREQDYAVIEVDSLGEEIRPEDLSQIFEQGTRGLTQARMGRIPGSGLGLWETRNVVEGHGGEVGVTCEWTRVRRRNRPAYHVIFSVTIPLEPEPARGRS